jgi:5-methylcytosine-specific restriction endonuclease McrA
MGRKKVVTTCIDCGTIITNGNRCFYHKQLRERKRNADPKRKAYRSKEYLSQPKDGICHICKLPGADTRDHIIPLSVDPYSTTTLPAHRACNSSRGDNEEWKQS